MRHDPAFLFVLAAQTPGRAGGAEANRPAPRRRSRRRRLDFEALERRWLLSASPTSGRQPSFDIDPRQAEVAAPSIAPGAISQAQVDAVLGTLTTTGRADSLNYLFTSESSALINLDDFRADARFPGVDGSGFAVVVLDTGIDLNHPAFGPDSNNDNVSDRIVYSYDFSGTNDPDASDFNGHGSNVTSIAASSSSTYTGMAPGADIIHLKVFPDNANLGASDADIEEALQWVVSNAAAYNIVSVNLSLGVGNVGYHVNDLAYSDEFAALADLDIMVSVAAGNSFHSVNSVQGVNILSADPSVVSVGAVYDANIGQVSYGGGAIAYSTAADRITPFSQRDEYLLDVLAPGAAIRGANQSGGTVTYHGTSQAAPHIAGIAALAQQLAVQSLGRRLTLDEFETLMRTSATTVNDGDDENDNVTSTELDFPRVDVLTLGEAILDLVPGSIGGTVFHDANANGVNDGEAGLADWTVYLDSNNNGELDASTTTIASTAVPVSIVDLDTRRSSNSVSDIPGVITDVDVQLDISHTWNGDIQVFLISPAGTRIELFTNVGGSGQGFSNTVLDDEAATNITAGSAPFSGHYRPEEALSQLDGENANGIWILEFSDDGPLDVGTLNSWSLILSYAELSQVTTSDGAYEFPGLPPATYVVRQVLQAEWTQTTPTAPDYYSVELQPGGLGADNDFGNIPSDQLLPLDIVLHAAEATGGMSLEVTYEITGTAAVPFDLSIYRSTDANYASGDLLLDTVQISAPSDLSVGVHTLTFAIGGGANQLSLPGAGAAESLAEYYLLFVADPADQLQEADTDPHNEDNRTAVRGVYHPAAGKIYVHGTDDADTLTVQPGSVEVVFNGTSYSYNEVDVTSLQIRAYAGDDMIDGTTITKPLWIHAGNGQDTLTGGAANDTILGGAGNDTYSFDTDHSLGADTLNEAGGGIDTLDFSATTTRAVAVNLALSSSQIVNVGLSLVLSSNATFENALGGELADTLTGNSLANLLAGGGGNDTLSGSSGNDTLMGGSGNDSLIGGSGNDTHLFDADTNLGTDTVNESGGGTDTLDFSPTTSLAVAVDLSSASQQTVNANLNLVLSSATTIEYVVGGDGDDLLTGNTLANRLSGGGGNDTINGSGGNDTLIGGAGNDSLVGGAGNDVHLFAADAALGTDTINESGGGMDTLDFSPTTSLAVAVALSLDSPQTVNANLELVLSSATAVENVVGGAEGDTLTGNSLANALTGGPGNDVLAGGTGNDTYWFDADDDLGQDTLQDTGGTDTLNFSLTVLQTILVDLAVNNPQTVNANLQLSLAVGTNIENITGGALGDTLKGNSLANTLNGGGGNDLLEGVGGNDVLTGGAGNDTLVGGAGNDRYLFDADSALGTDRIDEQAGEGSDSLDFSSTTTKAISLDLSSAAEQIVNSFLSLWAIAGQEVEILVGGALDDTLTGNSLANVLVGGWGNDLLNGLGGRDLLIGGSGSDTLQGGLGEDILVGGRSIYHNVSSGAAQFTALRAIMTEWTRSDADYATRIAHLMNGGGLNGSHRLNSTTVLHDSAAADQVFGDEDLDFFLAGVEDALNDRLDPDETLTLIL